MASAPAESGERIAIVTDAALLPIRARPATPMSDDALWRFCRDNPDLRVERSADGEILIMPPTGSETGRRNFLLIGRLAAWTERDGSGVGFDSSTGFILPNGAERSPDAAWIRTDRWEALSEAQRERFAPICPDFVVELRSRTDKLDEVQAKLVEYIDNGALLGWLIDPTEGRVHIYRPKRRTQTLDAPAELSAEPELPGFMLRLDGIL